MTTIDERDLTHWDHERVDWQELVRRLNELVSEHFADYSTYAEEGPVAAAARREWVLKLLSEAEQFSAAEWNDHWLEGWSHVLSKTQAAFDQSVSDWRERVATAKRHLDELRALENHGLPEKLYNRLLDDCRREADSPPPTEPEIAKDPVAVQVTVRRGLVTEHLLLSIADSLKRANRTLSLLDLITHSEPSAPLRAYLKRCGRTYVLGAFPETVVMCAAALERRLSEVLPQDAVKERFKLSRDTEVTLGRRLKFADDIGLFDDRTWSECKWLLQLRNNVVHFIPNEADSDATALRALRTLRACLSRLGPFGSGTASA